ncbi:MAG: N-acetylmuramoyl-L-alanine amidase [Clostridia bacterium]|nr:N-acetylmuramoyl-L-alanine amidase [Deltaproteobacteria bacterium]
MVRRFTFVVLVAALPFLPLCVYWSPVEDELGTAEMRDGLAAVGARVTRTGFVEALELIDPHDQLASYLTIQHASVSVYRDTHHFERLAEVPLRSTPLTEHTTPRSMIIDPGHWGGTWAEAEKRNYAVPGGPAIPEGEVALKTALRIRDKLADQKVTLTRTMNATAEFPAGIRPAYDLHRERRLAARESYNPLLPWVTPIDWVLFGPDMYADRAFDLYTRYDLRARVADASIDDVFISIHYNIASQRQTNGLMAFVYGDALDGELRTPTQRYWAIRRALDGTLPRSIALARTLANAMQRRMQLPALAPDPDEVKVNRTVLDAAAGLHARNLAVLRRARGVAVLLEGPCLNAPEEYQRFTGELVVIDGMTIPVRAEEYADAVAMGLREFFANVVMRP